MASLTTVPSKSSPGTGVLPAMRQMGNFEAIPSMPAQMTHVGAVFPPTGSLAPSRLAPIPPVSEKTLPEPIHSLVEFQPSLPPSVPVSKPMLPDPPSAIIPQPISLTSFPGELPALLPISGTGTGQTLSPPSSTTIPTAPVVPMMEMSHVPVPSTSIAVPPPITPPIGPIQPVSGIDSIHLPGRPGRFIRTLRAI